jgi:hypothetical protein
LIPQEGTSLLNRAGLKLRSRKKIDAAAEGAQLNALIAQVARRCGDLFQSPFRTS